MLHGGSTGQHRCGGAGAITKRKWLSKLPYHICITASRLFGVGGHHVLVVSAGTHNSTEPKSGRSLHAFVTVSERCTAGHGICHIAACNAKSPPPPIDRSFGALVDRSIYRSKETDNETKIVCKLAAEVAMVEK